MLGIIWIIKCLTTHMDLHTHTHTREKQDMYVNTQRAW